MVERIRTLLEGRQLTPTQFADLIGVARPIVSHILSGRNKPSLDVVQRILAALPDLAMPWLLTGSGPMLAAASALADGAKLSAATPVPLVPAVPAVPAVPVDSSLAGQNELLQQPSENQQYLPVAQGVIAPIPPAHAPVGRPASVAAEHPGRVSKPAPFKSTATPKRFVAKPLAVDKPGELGKLEAHEQPETALEPVLAPIDPGSITTASELCQVAVSGTGLPIANASGSATNGTPVANAAPASAMAPALVAGAIKPIRRIVVFYRDGSFADYQPE